MNTMILFGLIMGLGMLVDNGIVVVENVYRLMDEEGMTRLEAAKEGIGEIAFPIIISTATTVAAFIPLGLWPGLMGQFMIYFPITLSVVLGSSLFVAIFFNSVLVSQFMSVEDRNMPLKTSFDPDLWWRIPRYWYFNDLYRDHAVGLPTIP
jgi:multidrug efflux pump